MQTLCFIKKCKQFIFQPSIFNHITVWDTQTSPPMLEEVIFFYSWQKPKHWFSNMTTLSNQTLYFVKYIFRIALQKKQICVHINYYYYSEKST